MSHRIPIACVAHLGEGDLAGLAVHIGDTGQALDAEAALAELIATALEALLHRNANTGYLAPAASQILIRPSSAQPLARKSSIIRTLSPSDRKRLPTMTGYSFCLVKE